MFDLLPEREELTNPSTWVRSVSCSLAGVSAAGLLLPLAKSNLPLSVSLTMLLSALAWFAWHHLTAKQFYYSVMSCAIAMMLIKLWISP
jgi:hypothetical protein